MAKMDGMRDGSTPMRSYDSDQTEMFEGAGVIICEPGSAPENADGNMVVETKHAVAVSFMFFKLKAIFRDMLNYRNKYDFYQRLAGAALLFQSLDGDEDGIVSAVTQEGFAIANDWNKPVYFAYGSNMYVQQMYDRCEDMLYIGKAVLPGYTFAIDSHEVATVLPNKEENVYGFTYLISPADEACLDIFEGVDLGCYRKEYLTVSDRRRTCRALVYVSNRKLLTSRPRTTEYMGRILMVARFFEFPEHYLRILEKYAGLR